MMIFCLALMTQMGKKPEIEMGNNIIKRNGFVPLITSSLQLDNIHKNTLEEMCLKYANINITENCPICLCGDEILEEEEQTFECFDECTKELNSSESKVNKFKYPSLGFDKMKQDQEETVQEVFQNKNLKKAKSKKKIRIIGEMNEEEMLNIMDDEMPFSEEVLYICEKVNPTQNGPERFNLVLNSSDHINYENDGTFTTDKLKTY
jgi:hypothetical protein